MFLQEGGGDAESAGNPAGRAGGLEKSRCDTLSCGKVEDLVGPFDKLVGDVNACSGDDPGRTGENGPAVAADKVGRIPGGGQTSELFRADRNPGEIF
jgi:hypothetical protein